jgi:thioredoxin-like negative regulator of GroEL
MVMNGKGGPNVTQLFGVQAFPTNYLIGADGKILARFVGYDEDSLVKELKKAGFKP